MARTRQQKKKKFLACTFLIHKLAFIIFLSFTFTRPFLLIFTLAFKVKLVSFCPKEKLAVNKRKKEQECFCLENIGLMVGFSWKLDVLKTNIIAIP